MWPPFQRQSGPAEGSCPANAAEPESSSYAVLCGFLLAVCTFLLIWNIVLLRQGPSPSGSSVRAQRTQPFTRQRKEARAKPTDGAAPTAGYTKQMDAVPAHADAPPRAPPSVNETASPTTLIRGEETGSLIDAANAERLTSALALAQRVRDLGLHLGDVVVSGISVGLPNGETGRPVFDPGNVQSLMRGENLISKLPEAMLQAQLSRNVVQVHKSATGARVRKPLGAIEELIQLASRVGSFDLHKEYGVSPAVCETLDTTYGLAVAAGLEALKNAGLVEPPPAPAIAPAGASDAPARAPAMAPPAATGGKASKAEAGWRLPKHMRDETGVIFAASFPALDSLVDELAKHLSASLTAARAAQRHEWLAELRGMVTRRRAAAEAGAAEAGAVEAGAEAGAEAAGLAELSAWLAEHEGGVEAAAAAAGDGGGGVGVAASCPSPSPSAGGGGGGGGGGGSAGAVWAAPAVAGYEFNRKLLFKLLVMANSQLAELVQAKGPNLHINAACAGTTAAIALGHDWIRTGRAKRVVVISADNPSSDHLLPWVGIGFLALGAACTKGSVEEAALPFDKRRSGMLLGAGAVGLVLEADTTAAVCRPGRAPLSTVLGVRHAISAYHASAIGVAHASELLDALLRDVEVVHGLRRRELVQEGLLYVSHETFTYARNGGCAGAEVTALRAAFGDDGLRRLVVTNSKGITGHAMGVCFEDVVAVAALVTGLAPPVVHHKEEDPVLGTLRLSRGGRHECKYALHFAAGFGSQVTYVLYRR